MSDLEAEDIDVETAGNDPSTQEPPPDDASAEEKVKYTRARWTVQREHYLGLYKLWSRAILFLLNKQWLEWDHQSRRWSPEQAVPRWRQRPVTNLVFAVYRSAIAKLTKQRPTYDVVPPRTGDAEDREAANLGHGLLQQFWRALQMPKLLTKCIGWILCTGNVSVRVYWDTEGGEVRKLTVPIEDPMTGEWKDCACDENGEPIMKRRRGVMVPDFDAEPIEILEGEIGHEIISPLNKRWNPECKIKEDATEEYIGYLMPVAVAAKKWGVKPEDLKAVTDDELEETDDLISNAAGATQFLGMTTLAGDRAESIGPRCLVIEYHRRPDDEHKRGRHWIVAGSTLVLPEEELPEGFWPPTVDIEDIPVPGDPHAIGLLGQVLSLNREYNAKNGKIAEHDVMMAMGGKWVVHPLDKDMKINTDPGQKLVSKGYLEGKPPVQARLSTLPEGVYRERDRILADLKLVAGTGDVGVGGKAEGVSSGRGLLAQQEISDGVLAPTLFNIEMGLQEIGRRDLIVARRHYKEERILKVRGHNGRWEIRAFMGADLGDSIDVQVQIGSMFPWSRAARQDTALDLVGKLPGLVTGSDGQVDPVKLARILDVGGLQAFEPDSNPDLQEIELEHAMFEEFDPAKGILEVPQPGFWQNHIAHYDGHIRILKAERSRFERWSRDAQRLFIEHILFTRQLIETAAAEAAGNTPAAQPSAEPPAPAGDAPPAAAMPQQAPQGRLTKPAAVSGNGDAKTGKPPQLVSADFRAAGIS